MIPLLRIPVALAAAFACLYRMHVTVSMGGASLSMTGLAWFAVAVVLAVAVLLVLVIRKMAREGPWIVPRRRFA